MNDINKEDNLYKNKYVFIVWNKALFCKEKILEDLKKSFIIDKKFYIKWKDENFINNLKALYGTKANNYEEKIKYVGKDSFLVILVEDQKPVYEIERISGNENIVNKNVFDKKWLYRKWTAGNFRVHSSVNDVETSHDLTVLLGPNYTDSLKLISDNDVIEIDTKGVEGFSSVSEFEESLLRFGSNIIKNDVIICKQKKDIIDFIKPVEYKDNTIKVKIKDAYYAYLIFGVENGEMPISLLDKNNENVECFFDNAKNYLHILNKNSSEDINAFFNSINIDPVFVKKNNTIHERTSFIKRIKDWIKYHYLKATLK